MKTFPSQLLQYSDFPANGDLAEQIRFVCRYGLMAPSVHNLQPWQLKLDQDVLTVVIDPQRRLHEGDGTGREVWLSLGALTENLWQAATACGMKPRLNTACRDAEVAQIHFQPSQAIINASTLDAIGRRGSLRVPYQPQPLEPKVHHSLTTVLPETGCEIRIITDPAVIELIASLSARGLGMALSLPAFKRELSELMRPNWTKASDGLPGSVLGYGLIASVLRPLEFRYLDVANREAGQERRLIASSSAVALVFADGDSPEFWLPAGRTYQRVALAATRLRLAQSTSAAAVEAPDFHSAIEAACGTSRRLQTILRLGYSEVVLPTSPRRSLTDVLH